jgi:alkyl hydroperoxide reductase subunit AhpF
MSLLSAADQATLRESFSAMKHPVTILFVTQTIGCETCVETRQILDEITSLTSQVVVDEVNLVLDAERAASFGIDRAPALVLLSGEERQDTRIRFLGAPEGWDFLSLVDAILAVSGASDMALSDESQAMLGQLNEPITVRVFVTPT